MPSTCPKCHQVLENDEVCCAQVLYAWRCLKCHKLTTGFVMPYGKCHLCGGELEEVSGRNLGDALKHPALREAMQFELNAYHFYRLAWERTTNAQHKVILEYMFQNEKDHIHELEEKYHAHLDREVLDLAPSVDALLADHIFAGIDFSDGRSAQQLYQQAIEMEHRTYEHFRQAAENSRPGFEKELYQELAAEEQEHIAMLETEMRQFEA
jgi:glutamate synthase (NADPH/NADH) small chain